MVERTSISRVNATSRPRSVPFVPIEGERMEQVSPQRAVPVPHVPHVPSSSRVRARMTSGRSLYARTRAPAGTGTCGTCGARPRNPAFPPFSLFQHLTARRNMRNATPDPLGSDSRAKPFLKSTGLGGRRREREGKETEGARPHRAAAAPRRQRWPRASGACIGPILSLLTLANC